MAEGVGARVELSELPLKYPGLAPWEIWLSEAQERMVVAVADTAPLFEACERYGVECIDIGEFTGDERLIVTYEGTTVVDIDTNFLHDGRPQRQLNAVMPKPDRTPMSAESFNSVFGTLDVAATTLRLLAHPNIASKESIIRRYDHEIGGATLVRPIIGAQNDGHADGVVLADPLSSSGIAVGIGVNPWMGIIDAERMALAVVDEAMRNVVAVGADPRTVALLDNFSWGDPQRPTTLGELVAAVDGCCQAARAFGAPFVSGKDSLNNEYFGSDDQRHAVPPTLVITAMAHVPNADAVVTPDFKQSGNVLILLGRTLCEFGGSHLAMLNEVAGGVVPSFDTKAPQRYQKLHEAIQNGDVESCHDVSEGGIAVAIAEMAMAGRLGAEITVAQSLTPAWWYFSESCGRLILEVKHESVAVIRDRFGDDAQIIGRVVDEQVLSVGNGQTLTIEEMLTSWQGAS
jgi:phosphoribosylformylglycinamidine synthase